MHMRRKYVTHACMKAHISEHVYGEKPYMSKRKASKRRFCECGSEYIIPFIKDMAVRHVLFTQNP